MLEELAGRIQKPKMKYLGQHEQASVWKPWLSTVQISSEAMASNTVPMYKMLDGKAGVIREAAAEQQGATFKWKLSKSV